MNTTAQRFFKTAIILLIIGMAFGIHMAASQDHSIAPAHAHLNLLGFVVSAIYGTYFALNPAKAEKRLATIIWILHSVATILMFPFLALVLRGKVDLEPIVAICSIGVLIAAVLFAVIVFTPDVSRARA